MLINASGLEARSRQNCDSLNILNDLHVVVIRSFFEILQLVFLEKHTEKWSFIE